MKIAVCISGQLRGDQHQWRKIVEKFSRYECDFFLSVWDEMGGTTAIDRVIPPGYLPYFFADQELKKFRLDEFKSSFPILFDEFFSGGRVDKHILSEIFFTEYIEVEASPKNFLIDKRFGGVNYPAFLQERNPRDINCILMFYKIWSCFEMVKKSGISYDYVVRLRSDIDFGDWDGYIPVVTDGVIVKKTFIDEHVDDQFAIGRFSDMYIYSNLWEHLREYWSEPRGESSIYEVSGFLLAKHLEKNKVKVIKNYFPFGLTFSRKSNKDFLESIYLEVSSKKSSDPNLLKVSKEIICDIICDATYKKEIEIGEGSQSISSDFIKKFKSPSFQLLGFLAERLKDYDLAIFNYHQALAEDYRSFMSYSGLARVHQKIGNDDLAVSAWTAALGVRPDNWVCMREIAKINFKIGSPEISRYWLEKAKKISKAHSSVVELEKLFS